MSRLARALLFAAGAIVLAVLVARVGPTLIFDLLRRVGWAFLTVSLLYTVHLAVRSAALWRSLPSAVMRFVDVFQIRLAGEAVEMLTFTGPFLAEPTKGYLLTRRGATGPDAFGAVAIEYLLYTLVSAWLAAGALALLLLRNALSPSLRGPIIGLVVAIALLTAGFVVAAITGVGLIVPTVRSAGWVVGRQRAERAAAAIEPVECVLVTFMHARPGRLAEVIILEGVVHTLLALEVATVLHALGLPFGWLDPFIVEGGVKFISVVFFFIPGQIGASESVYTILFQALGFPAAAGLTLALVRRVRALVVAAAGTVALSLTS
ncbi:MAG TPA: lysylphosphatidylglycerol synthase domain-containing protein [Vicinamibacterales bacterium]